MGKKLRQVTDSIHGTIYLSDLESELISTPFFYRLHDVYQSSTVYMTFPCNRTKRYEHSLGTMDLASKILYSAITNANQITRNRLFKRLRDFFCEIATLVTAGEKIYFDKCKDDADRLFDKLEQQGGLTKEYSLTCIKNAVKKGIFNDAALDFHQYYPVEDFINSQENSIENIFLYRCLLQAIRIVALFHDVGHPPYSHIIEKVLKELYSIVDNELGEDREEGKEKKATFKQCLDPYFSKYDSDAFKCQRLFSQASLIEAQPHERIGLGLLDCAINEVIPQKIASIVKNDVAEESLANILYYITIVEFVFAILTEKNIEFKSFHKIVDGIIDADRLDYIVRDSKNSGVDWGTIPYERIINSAKLHYLQKNNWGSELSEKDAPFIIAYPQKISDDLEDLLLVRYKIFARINFHHRCMKTSMALQFSIKELAVNFLAEKKPIATDISRLWNSLDTRMGNKKIRIIQWNDSWLISVLHSALVNLYIQRRPNVERLKEALEEILLNKKKYYPLLKRGQDNCELVKLIFNKAGISKEHIEQLLKKEYKKYYNETGIEKNILDDPKSNAKDSIARISDIYNNCDLEKLCNFIPLKGDNIKQYLESVLSQRTDIHTFTIEINEGRGKNGLPKHKDILDCIYLYKGDTYTILDETLSLEPQIRAVSENVPWIYIYFVPKNEDADIEQLTSQLLDDLAIAIAEKFKERFTELFGTKMQDDSLNQ